MPAGDRRPVRAPVPIGVVGLADIAVRRMLPAIAASDRVRLVAVASRSAGKAKAVADRYGCAAVTGYQPLLDRDDIQAVYVPLPNALHEQWATAALVAGKHVLVEKSLTASTVAAQSLVDLAERRGLALVENFAFLHHGQHERLRRLLATGELGEARVFTAMFAVPRADPALIRYSRELAGGALRENGCYPIRAAQLYLGPGLTVVGAHLRYDPDSGVDIAGTVLLADPTHRTALCVFGLSHAYRNSCEIWGSTARAVLDWAFTPPPATRPVLRVHRQDRQEEYQVPAADQFLAALAAFADTCADPVAQAAARVAVVGQAALLESVRCHAGAPTPTTEVTHVPV